MDATSAVAPAASNPARHLRTALVFPPASVFII
jgi:hypothetical protein